jgi:transcriptional regulator with XRE-family HTH domain
VDRFAENLTRAMGLHCLNARQLAALVGLSHHTVSSWRSSGTSKRAVSLPVARRVAGFLGLPLEVLLDGTPDVVLSHLADLERFRAVEERIHRIARERLTGMETGEPL